MSDQFDSEINAEEIQDHDPDETCSTCGERVINCTCVENESEDNCSTCYMKWSECQCYEDLYGGENEWDYDPDMDWWWYGE